MRGALPRSLPVLLGLAVTVLMRLPGADITRLPLMFEQVSGSPGTGAEFRVRGPGYALIVRNGEAVLTSGSGSARMRFAGASRRAAAEGAGKLPGIVNYFVGNNPARWRTGIPTYARVRCRGIYPGVDLEYYGNQGRLEYDLVIAPGADPKVIELALEGAGALTVDARGDLLLGRGTLRLRKPLLYQDADGARREVAGGYVLRARNRAAFHIGAYDPTRPLVIDPVLVFSTFLGGSGNENDAGASDDTSTTSIAVDPAGNIYVTGNTTSADFPSAAPLQKTYGGNVDAYVAKLDPTGSTLLYCTYLGGSQVDRGFAIAVDRTGSAYVAGRTHSPDLPVVNAFQRSLRSYEDGFLSKLSPDGKTLVYSTFLGGINNDDIIALAVDSAGSAYVAGETQSPDFPVASPAQPRFSGRYDGFVTKFNPEGSGLVYSTFLGGTRGDDIRAIAVDQAGNAYIAGYTESADLPVVNALQPAYGGGSYDALAAKLDPKGALVYSTYLGGSGPEWGLGIAVDSSGSVYLTGMTASKDFPVTKDALQPVFAGGGIDAFLVKLNPEGSATIFSSFFGGPGDDAGLALALDPPTGGTVCLTGLTTSTNFPASMPGSIQTGYGGGRGDAFLARFSPPAFSLNYFTYLGGSGEDTGQAIAVDAAGNMHVAGTTESGNFPVSAQAVQRTIAGGRTDGFIVKIRSGDAGMLVSLPATSYARSTGFAAESIVAAYGEGLADATVLADRTPLPVRLGGRSVTVRDSTGRIREAPLIFVSPRQVNYLIPAGTALGAAEVRVLRETSTPNVFATVASETIEISRVAPGLFTANADGKGAAAAVATLVAADGSTSWQYTFRCGATPGSCQPEPVELGAATGQVILQLFGSGIRGCSDLGAVSVKIGGVDAEVLYAAAQASFAGLDQVNVRLPRSLAGRGEIDLLLAVEGKPANTVKMIVR